MGSIEVARAGGVEVAWVGVGVEVGVRVCREA